MRRPAVGDVPAPSRAISDVALSACVILGRSDAAGRRPSATFPVVCSRDKLVRYLRDQGSLELEVYTDRLVGVAVLGEDLTSAIDLAYVFQRDIPVKGNRVVRRRRRCRAGAHAHVSVAAERDPARTRARCTREQSPRSGSRSPC